MSFMKTIPWLKKSPDSICKLCLVAGLLLSGSSLPASSGTLPMVDLVSPRDGAVYRVGDPIELEAVAVDPDEYAASLEFHSGMGKIAESTLVFVREPDKGQPIRHAALWENAPPGRHIITAKALDDSGLAGVSQERMIEVTGGIVPNPAQPVITAIRIEKDHVVVDGEVPAGVMKVTLESRDRLGAGAWQPRVVTRTEGKGGAVTYRLAKSASIELLRLRADSSDPLPASFYNGTNQFNGPMSSTLVTRSDVETSINSTAAGPADKSAAGAADRSVVESDI